jgi:hypothetical protein
VTTKRRTLDDWEAEHGTVGISRSPEAKEKEQREFIQQGLDDLVRRGLIMDSGARRNGQVVYTKTPFGKSPEGRAVLRAWEGPRRPDPPVVEED